MENKGYFYHYAVINQAVISNEVRNLASFLKVLSPLFETRDKDSPRFRGGRNDMSELLT